MRKKIVAVVFSAALLAGIATPALAVPPGPPDPATTGCPGRTVVDPGAGPQAGKPDNHPPATNQDGELCLPPSGVQPGPPA